MKLILKRNAQFVFVPSTSKSITRLNFFVFKIDSTESIESEINY